MKKTFVGAALATAAVVPAFAQSSVILYGRLNLSLESQDFVGSDKRVNEVVDNASRLGLRISEDLGAGLKAGVVIEHGFDASTGQQAGSAYWNRQSEINLSGPFGMVRLGNFTSEAYYATADYVSLHNHDTGTSADRLYADANLGNQVNKVAYRTPTMGGFWAEFAAMEAVDGERGYDAAANYDAGPLHLGAGYSKHGDAQQFALRALYEFGNLTLGSYVQRDKNIFLEGNRTSGRVSAMYTMGASEFHVNAGYADDYSSLDKSNSYQVTLAYNYNLSKRTKLYTFYTMLGKDRILQVYGGSFNSFAVGMRHNF
ncbi:MAG TPA: porin [Ideonella sp.]|nr:porin [Ideonella sp.]